MPDAPAIDALDVVFVVVTGAVALHGLSYRDANGERPWVHLLFGSIALLFSLRVLFFDIVGFGG